jgi:glutaconate CoA-transferase subunit A
MLRVLRERVDPLGIRRLEFAPARERAQLLAACIAAEQDLIDQALRPPRRAEHAFSRAAKE